MAKFCKNCGTELKEGKVCQNCGTVNEGAAKAASETTTTPTPASSNATSGNNGLAIAGFVLALVGVVTCGVTSVLGLIFSIIGLSTANRDKKEGKGLAIAGIAVSGAVIVIWLFIWIIAVSTGNYFYRSYYSF